LAVFVLGCGSDLEGSGAGGRLLAPGHAAANGFNYAVVGAAGGQVSDGSSSLEIPPGALATPVGITLETVVEGGRNAARISPAGLHFARPATLHLQLPPDGRSSADYRILGFDAVAGVWVGIGGTVSSGIITAPITDGTRYQVEIIG
jgi:hypothetical protein